MNYNHGISSYRNIQFGTEDPGRLILLLFNKLDEKLNEAKDFILKKDWGGKGDAILWSQDIIMELNNSLNLEAGDIAHNLRSLYLYMFRELNNANFKKDIDKLNVVIKITCDLKSAWEEIINKPANVTDEYTIQESKTKNVAYTS